MVGEALNLNHELKTMLLNKVEIIVNIKVNKNEMNNLFAPFQFSQLPIISLSLTDHKEDGKLDNLLGSYDRRFEFVVNFQKLLRHCLEDLLNNFSTNIKNKPKQMRAIEQMALSIGQILPIIKDYNASLEPLELPNGIFFQLSKKNRHLNNLYGK